jgi:hypothetical protein
VPLYFAYGSNMNVEAMARRCPRSKALGLGRLERHRLPVMREGWLTARSAIPPPPCKACFGALRYPTSRRSTATRAFPRASTPSLRSQSSPSAARNRRLSISAPMPGLAFFVQLTLRRFWPRRAHGNFRQTMSRHWSNSRGDERAALFYLIFCRFPFRKRGFKRYIR